MQTIWITLLWNRIVEKERNVVTVLLRILHETITLRAVVQHAGVLRRKFVYLQTCVLNWSLTVLIFFLDHFNLLERDGDAWISTRKILQPYSSVYDVFG